MVIRQDPRVNILYWSRILKIRLTTGLNGRSVEEWQKRKFLYDSGNDRVSSHNDKTKHLAANSCCRLI